MNILLTSAICSLFLENICEITATYAEEVHSFANLEKLQTLEKNRVDVVLLTWLGEI